MILFLDNRRINIFLRKLVVILCLLITNYSYAQVGTREYKKFYYPNGFISSEGFFKNGKPDGFWKTYYVNGVLKSDGLWRNASLDSTWKFYDNLGNVSSVINYYGGKKSGYYYVYKTINGEGHNKPIIISKELYINDKHEDYGYYYRSDGSLQTISHYLDGKKDGVEKEFNTDSVPITIREFSRGRLIFYEEINRVDSNGNPYGIWKVFFKNGRVKEELVYVNGKLNGYFKIYTEKGALLNAILYRNDSIVRDSISNDELVLREVVDSINGKLERGTFLGKHRVGNHYFYTKGIVDSCVVYNYRGVELAVGKVDTNGFKKGKWLEFYEGTRTLKAKGDYILSQKVGSWSYFYKNGLIEQKGTFINGRISGNWEWFYANGALKKYEEYINGLHDGLFYELNENADTLIVGNYISGMKDGFWKILQGDLLEQGSFVNDFRDGVWKYFYENGKLYFKGSYTQGIADGKHQFFYQNGLLQEEQFYSNGYPVGIWRKFSEDGFAVISIQYKNGEVYKINGFRVEE